LIINSLIGIEYLYAQEQWQLDDYGSSYSVVLMDNYLLLLGVIKDDKIPDWRGLISYDPKCLEITFEPENFWQCDNIRLSQANSESFRYWLRVKIIGENCDPCVMLAGHPEYGKICFKDPFRVKPLILNNCDEDIGQHDLCNIDEKIRFGALLTYNKDPELGPVKEPPRGLTGEIRTRLGNQEIPLTWDHEVFPNQIYYRGDNTYSARELLPGMDSHYGELMFSVSFLRVSSVSKWFSEFPNFFDIDSLRFQNTIQIANNGTGYQQVCVPFNSQLSFGSILEINTSGWPYNCPIRATLSTYRGDEYLLDQQINLLANPSYSGQSASSIIMPDAGHGSENVFYFNWKLAVEDGPALQLPNERRIGIFNGFKAGPITPLNLPESGILSPEEQLDLRANPCPNLSNATYSWHYTFEPDNGNMPAIASEPFNPSISNEKTTTFTAPDFSGTCKIYYVLTDIESGEFVKSPDLILKIETKLVIDTPQIAYSYFITPSPERPKPQMPRVPFRAHLDGVPDEEQTGLNFRWTMKLTYQGDELERTGEITGLNSWVPDWGDDIMGGAISAEVKVDYLGKTYTATFLPIFHARVLGRNIEGDRKAVVNAYIDGLSDYNNVVKSAAKGAACYETPYYWQFTDEGLPFIQADDGGRGIMQLTCSDYINRNTIWNWKANVAQGVSCCNERYARAHEELSLYDHIPTNEELTKQILARYNGPSAFTYWTWNGTDKFERNPAYCNDCGTCNTVRSAERVKNPHNKCVDCQHTQSCYADGAYNCSH
jgi:hypothetical protein